MPRPKGYKDIRAHEDSIAEAREAKKQLEITWNEFLESAAEQLTD